MNYLDEMNDEAGAALGDPRRCRRHPWEVTSSPDGMHDCPCSTCEYECETGERVTQDPRTSVLRTTPVLPEIFVNDPDIPF